jgi:D-alanyl-D-alanine carboxypeptidase/D-alanyl-D-alanine-endopeptidase (penicillin-binding protein 4)
VDAEQDLKVKGYGDPLLISEVWREMALDLASRLDSFRNLLVDNTYFSSSIRIPGRGRSTNPYDAPVGALSANFNTVFYHRDEKGKIVSAEPQTPITPLARRKILDLEQETGRYTFLREDEEIARYGGELLAHFLKEQGVAQSGGVYAGPVGDNDRLIHTYRSRFALETAVEKMLEYSNNFMANQLLVAVGAHIHGAPGTREKGIWVLETFCEERLGIKGIRLVEGSGISRENQLTAVDMLRILKAFTGYRHLLTKQGNIRYKSGTLRGIRTRAGYIEPPGKGPHPFVLFLKDSEMDIERVMEAVAKTVR